MTCGGGTTPKVDEVALALSHTAKRTYDRGNPISTVKRRAKSDGKIFDQYA